MAEREQTGCQHKWEYGYCLYCGLNIEDEFNRKLAAPSPDLSALWGLADDMAATDPGSVWLTRLVALLPPRAR